MTALELLQIAFWTKVDKSNLDGCWTWMGKMRRNGYGVMNVGHKSVKAHRLSWIVNCGDPLDRLVCHACDNPKCVRPDHLFLGTPADNYADMVRKGRQARMPRGGGKRTPDRLCQKVVELCRSGMTFKAIAAEVNLSIWTVSAICKERGEHSRSREVVNEEQIGVIRQVFASGFSKTEIARAAGISLTVVNKIIYRRGAYGSLEDARTIDSSKVDAFAQQLKASREQSNGITRTKTPEVVSLIRKMSDDGATYDDMQKATGACHMTIWKIVKQLGPYADPTRSAPDRRGPHKRTSKQVGHVREMAAGGASYDVIRGETRLSRSTIWRILRRPEQFGPRDRSAY